MILDASPDPAFDDLAARTAAALNVPMAAISFFDADRNCEWFKAAHGIALSEWPQRLCLFRAQQPFSRVFTIADAAADARFARHPLVESAPSLRFYAGAALLAPGRSVVGVLAVFDVKPRALSARDTEALLNLADLVQARVAMRRERPRAPATVPAPPRPLDAAQQQSEDALHLEHLTREYMNLNQLLEDEIATRKSAEDRLRQEKEFADAAIESLPGAFYMFSANGRMLRWNGSFETYSGFAREEIATRHPLDFIAAKDRAAVANAIQRVFEEGREVSLEADMCTKSGELTPYLFSGRPLHLRGETVLIGVGRDISERKRAEEQVLQAKERLDLALQGSSLALWDWDLVTNTVYFNERWAALTGAPPREAIFPSSSLQQRFDRIDERYHARAARVAKWNLRGFGT